MNEKDFVMNYLQPSDHKLDRTFTHPLPNIKGPERCGDFIVQGELEETFSTNIITKYASDILGIKLVEVYKNTQHRGTRVFVRIVGALIIVKSGYPFLILDAAVTNVSPLTAEREEITTRVAIHLPQANPEQRKLFFGGLSEKAKRIGTSHREMASDTLPIFWGSVWLVELKRFDLDIIKQLRDYAWISYKGLTEQTQDKSPFDYRPVQEHMIFTNSRAEHLLFAKMGLSVPIEAQAASFSMQVFGV